MQVTFLFPGQGSQKIGMGLDMYEAFDSARARFTEAAQILGRDIGEICFRGPEDQLKATQNTQPALFTVESVITDILAARGIRPSYAAGHSLGEYSALYAAGVVSFADGLSLVARRGQLMAEVGVTTPGTMAAIIGLSGEKIRDVLEGVKSGIVVAANENGTAQTVISGEIAAVKEACVKLTEAGAKRAIELPVSGAFHSPLMQKAADQFAGFLAGVSFNTPSCPVIANVTGRAETDPAVLKDLLVKQLVSPVRWVAIMGFMQSAGCTDAIEIGPGTVLKGLVKNFSKDINVVSCETAENVYSLSRQPAA